MSKTVVVGMSGGVDSSLTALLLKQQGYKVIGMFMKNWEERDANGVCQSEKEYQDVVRVCEQIDIPYYTVEFVKEYWDNVFSHFLREFQQGHTPNPDILCNREIKFNLFLKKALAMGADYLATGHYCQNLVMNGDGAPSLVKGVDPGKDQTYFLYTINQEILSKVLFPIGGLQKTEVRELALKHNLATHAKKDSTGICFIGERNFPEFLSKYLTSKPGKFRTLDGKAVGDHNGAIYYTLGQRRGLGLGGEGESWFVVDKDISSNTVFVVRGGDHPALFADYLIATEMSWVAMKPPVGISSGQSFRCKAKVRYRQADQDCTVSQRAAASSGEPEWRVDFDQPQRAITPRQSVVFYQGDVCLGGGMIQSAGPSYYRQQKPLPVISKSNTEATPEVLP
jgi:tRNA-specific 2-thiouridylase